MLRSLFLWFITSSLIISCNTTKQISTRDNEIPFTDQIKNIIIHDSIFIQSHTGLVVKDIESGKEILSHKGSHYFTPASNTKLLTFYTSLRLLDEQITGIKYYETPDSLVIWGTGDPSFLNPKFDKNDFISEELLAIDKPIYLSTSNFYDKKYGSGWSWDDENYAYQCEKNSLPIYGNLINLSKPELDSDLIIKPPYFKEAMTPNMNSQGSTFMRSENDQGYQYDKMKLDSVYKVDRNLPFRTDSKTIIGLLSDHWDRKVHLTDQKEGLTESKVIRSINLDSLYMQLLHPSDNFVAEQLLLNCGSVLFDSLHTRKVIDWAKENLFPDMPHDYQWVDGSGLSRYNMITPQNMVYILELIYKEMEEERLFELLPTGGESGTIKNLYAAEEPFVHAKTGSLSNNHSLSGYLIGDSGKTYIFSLMNSNYLTSNADLKKGMDRILRILKKSL